MTIVILKRSQSTSLPKASPTKKGGANPSTLSYYKTAMPGEILALFSTPFPADVMKSESQIVDATFVVHNFAAVGDATLSVYRITAPWSAANQTWNTKPSYDTGVVTAVTKASSAAGEAWTFDVTEQVRAMQSAGKNFGLLIAQTAGAAASGRRLVNTGPTLPTLVIEYSTGPVIPSQMSPSEGQVVSAAKPTLRVTSPQLGEAVHELKVQIDAGQDGVSPDFDSGWVDGSTASIDTSAYVGAPTMTAGVPTSWRVNVRDIDGTESGWSAWQEYTYQPLGTLTISNPPDSPDNVVTDPSPPVTFELTGQTQTAYRVRHGRVDAPTTPLWDSGIISSADELVSPSKPVATSTSETYWVSVETWDQHNRVANGAQSEHVTAYKEYTFELSASVAPFDTFSLVDLDPLPYAKLVMSRVAPPDQIQVIRDGESVGVFDAADLYVSGDDYEFIDFLAAPRREHTWYVRAVVNGETSAANTPLTATLNPSGLWLSEPDKDRYLPFITQQNQAVGLTEDGGTFNPLNAKYGVRITSSLRGWSGSVVGEILATPLTDGATGSELRDMFLAMRDDVGAPMVLTLLDMNLKVVAFNMTVSPTPTLGSNEDYVYVASLEFIEVP